MGKKMAKEPGPAGSKGGEVKQQPCFHIYMTTEGAEPCW